MPKRFAAFSALAIVAGAALASACSEEAGPMRLGDPSLSPDDGTTDRADAAAGDGGLLDDGGALPDGGAAPDLPFFSAAYIEDHVTATVPGQSNKGIGDLWPSCWGDDDALYTANGDGDGFGTSGFHDILVNRVTGSPFDTPSTLAGTALAGSDDVGTIWTPGNNHNRKPTGMLCVDGDIYLAVQDLSKDFNDAPAASISVSHDHGKTWTWDKSAPMFKDSVMTTLMFLDFGKNNANAIDDYAYVYALDHNWRFSSTVPSPTQLWLARVPKDKIRTRSAWTYYAGTDADGTPSFVADIDQRVPVLEDTRKVYTRRFDGAGTGGMTVLSQGGIVYVKALDRYLYTSWTEFTFEFYEAPKPWGPWKPFLSRDFGIYPWIPSAIGGYTTTIPSKFISPDGKTLFVQSNTFTSGQYNYALSLRKMFLEPYVSTSPSNELGTTNLAARSNGALPISRAGHAGATMGLIDGAVSDSIDSWTGERKEEDYWGVVWPRTFHVNRVAYTTGKMFGTNGGWFDSLRVQARFQGKWFDVGGATILPPYPYSNEAGSNVTYTIDFDPVVADGIRITGAPGGEATFTSAAEIAVYYR